MPVSDVPELRVDPLTGLHVIVAGSRASRPGGLATPDPPPPIDPANDPFAEGNEGMTPPEVWADRPVESEPDTPGWKVRSVPNLYPALAPTPTGMNAGTGANGTVGPTVDANSDAGASAGAAVSTDARTGVHGYEVAVPEDPLSVGGGVPRFLVSRPAYGTHEVIVNSPEPVQTLADLSREQLAAVLAGWATRMRALTEPSEVAYLQLCVNEGRIAGASLQHTHSQLYALPFVPALVARERDRTRAYFEQTQGRSLVEDLLAEEVRAGERLIAIDDHMALIAPYASGSPMRMTIVPRRPEPRFETSKYHVDGIMFTALGALRAALGGMPALNMYVRTAPVGCDQFCWRIEIAPRLGQAAGFEMGTGVYINARTPEHAASELREAVARH